MSGHAHRDQAGYEPKVEQQHNDQAVRASHTPQRRAASAPAACFGPSVKRQPKTHSGQCSRMYLIRPRPVSSSVALDARM